MIVKIIDSILIDFINSFYIAHLKSRDKRLNYHQNIHGDLISRTIEYVKN